MALFQMFSKPCFILRFKVKVREQRIIKDLKTLVEVDQCSNGEGAKEEKRVERSTGCEKGRDQRGDELKS